MAAVGQPSVAVVVVTVGAEAQAVDGAAVAVAAEAVGEVCGGGNQ